MGPSAKNNQVFPPENVTIYFLKDILGRKKAYVPNNEVKTVYVPQYENLTVAKILNQALT